ncbi:MAG: tRNA uridine-5-carboxymethylaminomethyl(34) synthesis GTPase MnmE [Paracoccaceae bacterium]|nr:MAG: tRNA uridine-5-carboxymethylaminomethyl(34) synthesis GTPase MnmE [Paracoccaceae bacterium]
MDTIFALATARGKAGVAVVRISGNRAHAAATMLAGTLPPTRFAGLRKIARDGEVIDEALVLAFAEGASFTGEPVVELHLHGGRAVVDLTLDSLRRMPGLRMAEPGEFTRRALENGRLDLAQVEGLADLIDAETEVQRRQAIRELSGSVAARADAWRADILRAEGLLAAAIDFADEDVPDNVLAGVDDIVARLLLAWRAEVAGTAMAERVRDGFEVAIVGSPNAGKSTLLNALAGRDVALTSAVAGTTRDVIEVRMDLRGLPVTVLDTAGLRDAADEVEAMGVARARARARAADLRVFLLDDDGLPAGLAPQDDDILCQGKADLRGAGAAGVSGVTGQGVTVLLEMISDRIAQRAASVGTMTRQRHRQALEKAIGSLESARDLIGEATDHPELLAERLREARTAVEMLVGRIDVEEILGEVFARFCIGK